MRGWQDKSNFEINKAVKSVLVSKHEKESDFDRFFLDILKSSKLDYCNDAAFAWPIIDKIWTELNSKMPRSCTSKWQNQIDLNGGNKLRAAMICYLEMNGVKP